MPHQQQNNQPLPCQLGVVFTRIEIDQALAEMHVREIPISSISRDGISVGFTHIIRQGRERAALRLASADEIAALASPIHPDHTTADIDDWRLITLSVGNTHLLFLIGNKGREN